MKEQVDFRHYINEYIESLDRKEITKTSYKKILLKFEEYCFNHSIYKPEKRDILGYKKYLSRSVRSASIQKTIVVLRGFFTKKFQESPFFKLNYQLSGGVFTTNDFNDINTAIEFYVDYYNNHRLTIRLGYMSPVEYSIINGFN